MKKLLRRHKTILITLGIYWPALFLLTHIPVPKLAGESGMSDKTMHVLAYFALTFLAWHAISPYETVNWRKRKAWFLAGAIICYAAADEFLQGLSFIGRSIELLDFVSNMAGMVLAMAILSMLGFWASLLAFSAIFMFAISNLSVLLTLYPQFYLNTVFHLTAYTAFTLIWIQWLDRAQDLSVYRFPGMLHSLWFPLFLLLLIKASSLFFGRVIEWIDVATAVFGISSAILISILMCRMNRRQSA